VVASGLGAGYSRKHIIEAHHGKIWAESKSGKGSTFYFLAAIFFNLILTLS